MKLNRNHKRIILFGVLKKIIILIIWLLNTHSSNAQSNSIQKIINLTNWSKGKTKVVIKKMFCGEVSEITKYKIDVKQ